MAKMEVNVSGTNRAEVDINFPSYFLLPHSLSCCIAFLIFLYFVISERKSGKIKSLSSELSKRLWDRLCDLNPRAERFLSVLSTRNSEDGEGRSYCLVPLFEECPQHHGHKGDPEVTPGTCGAIGERAQVILV